jgi:hypothetical protein
MLWCFFNFVFSEEPDTKNFDGTEWGLYCEQARRQAHSQLKPHKIADNVFRHGNGSNTFKHEVAARHRFKYSHSPGVKTMPIGY